VLVAFTAVRLEYGWQRMPANSAQLNSLKGIKLNHIESAMENLSASQKVTTKE
jgi:hypothetical protein